MPKIFSLIFGRFLNSAPIIVKDEGVEVTDSVSSMDFVGAGVSATATGSDVTITVNSSGDSFTQMQPMTGTTPVADTGSDTLTFSSSDNLLEIAGNSTTDTLDFKAGSALNATVRGLFGATQSLTYNSSTGVFGTTNLPIGYSLNVNFPLNYNDSTRTVGITLGASTPIVYDAVTGFYGITFGQVSIDRLNDVDTGTTLPIRDQVLKWDGTKWVPQAFNFSFAMTILSFSSNQTATQLIGSGTWKGIAGITFTASYNNPPPNGASVAISGTGGVSWAGGQLAFTTPFTSKATVDTTAYPSTKDTTIVFTLTALDGATQRTATDTITFRNNVHYGVSTKASGYTSSDVTGLAGSTLTNNQNQSVALSPSGTQYLIFAFPSSYTSISATGFLFNSVTCPFEAFETVSVTNSAGFTENYKVYRSTNLNLGSSTLTTSTSSNLINRIYYGVSTVANGYTEADVEGLGTSVVSNTKGRTITPTSGATEYVIYALPTRLGTVTFTVGGFEGGFQSPETVSITNVNGYSENYDVYRSTNLNLGTVTVVVT